MAAFTCDSPLLLTRMLGFAGTRLPDKRDGCFNARTTALLGLGPIILCRDYLPVPVSFQPGIGPDESLNALASIGIFPDAAFATVKNSKTIPEKMDFYFTETALA